MNYGNKIAVSANNHLIAIYDKSDNFNNVIECTGHNNNIPCIDFSQNGKYIASISIDNYLRIWNVNNGKCIKSKFISNEWGWSVKWIYSKSIRGITLSNTNWQTIRNSLNQYFPNMNNNIFDNEIQEEIQEDDKEELNKMNELIVCCTMHHIFLCNCNIEIIASLYNGMPRSIIPVPAFMRHMERISFIDYIPEFSTLIVGSQGCCTVMLMKIVKNINTGDYLLIPQKIIPEDPVPSPLIGMTISKHISNNIQNRSFVIIYLLYQNRSMYSFEIILQNPTFEY